MESLAVYLTSDFGPLNGPIKTSKHTFAADSVRCQRYHVKWCSTIFINVCLLLFSLLLFGTTTSIAVTVVSNKSGYKTSKQLGRGAKKKLTNGVGDEAEEGYCWQLQRHREIRFGAKLETNCNTNTARYVMSICWCRTNVTVDKQPNGTPLSLGYTVSCRGCTWCGCWCNSNWCVASNIQWDRCWNCRIIKMRIYSFGTVDTFSNDDPNGRRIEAARGRTFNCIHCYVINRKTDKNVNFGYTLAIYPSDSAILLATIYIYI